MAKRELILNDIETSLAAIKVVGGFNNNIGVVTRESENIEHYDITDYPLAIISWSDEDKEGEDVGFDCIEAFLTITIRGAVYATATIETVLNLFLDDIEVALVTDPERSGTADLTAPIAIRVYQGPREHTLVFDFTFLLKYSYARGVP